MNEFPEFPVVQMRFSDQGPVSSSCDESGSKAQNDFFSFNVCG